MYAAVLSGWLVYSLHVTLDREEHATTAAAAFAYLPWELLMPLYVVCLFVCLFLKIKKGTARQPSTSGSIFSYLTLETYRSCATSQRRSRAEIRVSGSSETWNKFFHLTETTNMILSVLIYTGFIRHTAPCYLNPRLFQHVCLSLNISTLCKRPKRTSCLQLCSRYITTPVVCESRKRNRVDDPPGGSSRPVALRCTTPGTGWVPHRHLLRLSSSRLKARIS